MKKIILLVLFVVPITAFSQFRDDFSDKKLNDRTVNWKGNLDQFIVNSELQLQLNAPKATGKSFISTLSGASENTVWELWCKLGFSPSSSNYAKVYLTSMSETLNENEGCLYVRIGHTNKNFCIMMNDGNTEKTLITGSKDRLSSATSSFKIKVLLSKKGRLELYSKLDGETSYTLEGNAFIEKTIQSSHFGLLCQYTSTRNTLFYFDDIEVRGMTEDENNTLDEKYGDNQTGEKADVFDVVFNEIMFNAPTESEEYIELYNRSEKALDLKFLSLTTRKTDGSLNKSYPIANNTTILEPGEYAVVSKNIDAVCSFFLCRNSGLMINLGSTPILNNTGGDLVMLNNYNEKVIDEFIYTEKMHSSARKDRKGVALERINPDKETNDTENWTSATELSKFGTPGYINSQHNSNPNSNTVNELFVVYPDIYLNPNNYEIHYHFDIPGNRCRILLFDMMGRLINRIANNELLGTEGSIYFNNSGQSLRPGVYVIYAEVYSDHGFFKKYKIPMIIR